MAHSVRYDLTWTGTISSDTHLGQEHTFRAKDYTNTSTNPAPFNSAKTCAILCINKSGGTLAKGSMVVPSDTASYEYPYGCKGLASTHYCGQVSPYIDAATVADGAGFWLIVEGVTHFLYGAGTILVGSFLETAATGRTALYGTSSNIKCGVSREAISSGAGTLYEAYMFRP